MLLYTAYKNPLDNKYFVTDRPTSAWGARTSSVNLYKSTAQVVRTKYSLVIPRTTRLAININH